MGVMPASIPVIPAMPSSVPRTVLATILPARSRPTAASGLLPTAASSAIPGTLTPAIVPTVTPAVTAVTAPTSATAVSVPTPVASAGLLLGQGLAPLPAKLVKKIIALEFVEMADFMPEAWLLDESAMEAQLRCQPGPVTAILQCIQCFATFASTLSTAYPGTTAELMAFMACIVRCHQDYEGPAWVLYDLAFRRRPEMTKDLKWSVVNTSLFNLCCGAVRYANSASASITQLRGAQGVFWHGGAPWHTRQQLMAGGLLPLLSLHTLSQHSHPWKSAACSMPGVAADAGPPTAISHMSAPSAGLLAMEPGSVGTKSLLDCCTHDSVVYCACTHPCYVIIT